MHDSSPRIAVSGNPELWEITGIWLNTTIRLRRGRLTDTKIIHSLGSSQRHPPVAGGISPHGNNSSRSSTAVCPPPCSRAAEAGKARSSILWLCSSFFNIYFILSPASCCPVGARRLAPSPRAGADPAQPSWPCQAVSRRCWRLRPQ